MEQVLLNTENYNGRYGALRSFEDHTIVGAGDDPESALNDARAKGFDNPVLLYVPEREVVHIYSVKESC
jgi:hypothetical protein